MALTWPTIMHLDSVLLGGGELGGWRWREWWHFKEIESIAGSDMGLFSSMGMLIGLGRFPETGNILDLILLSYPLEYWFGWPMNHNLKVLLILIGNGICGYALARTFTDSWIIALVGGTVAILNPLVIQDINKLGLRQVILWWLLLYPIFLRRAQRTGTMADAMAAGILFVLTSAFYWFYGMFAGMMTLVHVVSWWWRERPTRSRVTSWGVPFAVTSMVGVFIFVTPYLGSGSEETDQRGGVTKLPEVTFFQSFPAYETIASAPERPQDPKENVLSSLHRTIDSAWPADYVVNVGHGAKAFPILVTLCGIIPAFFLRKARTWVVIWSIFYVGTLGPWLKIGAQRDTSEVVTMGEYVVRLPYAIMFQIVPGMSRMFAPYRMASMVVVASVVLVAISLNAIKPKYRRLGASLVLIGVWLQPFYRFDLGPVAEDSDGPAMWRVPLSISTFELPEWYGEVDPEGWEGIIELPLEKQQDLLCAYQSFHQRKVYRSWATEPAIPPTFRRAGGGDAAKRMRWLAKTDPTSGNLKRVLEDLTRNSTAADLNGFMNEELTNLMDQGGYRWLILHQRGYYLTEPDPSELGDLDQDDECSLLGLSPQDCYVFRGKYRYEDVVIRWQQRLGIAGEEQSELLGKEWPGMRESYPVCEREGEVRVPAWMPWASKEVQLQACAMPLEYKMHVFDLQAWRDQLGPDSPDGNVDQGQPGDGQGQPGDEQGGPGNEPGVMDTQEPNPSPSVEAESPMSNSEAVEASAP